LATAEVVTLGGLEGVELDADADAQGVRDRGGGRLRLRRASGEAAAAREGQDEHDDGDPSAPHAAEPGRRGFSHGFRLLERGRYLLAAARDPFFVSNTIDPS